MLHEIKAKMEEWQNDQMELKLAILANSEMVKCITKQIESSEFGQHLKSQKKRQKELKDTMKQLDTKIKALQEVIFDIEKSANKKVGVK